MKKQKNIFQLEKENLLLKEKIILSEVNKLIQNHDKTKFLPFLDNFNYLEKIVELLTEYDFDAYLLYISLINKTYDKVKMDEFKNEIESIIINTIKPFSPLFFHNHGIILFSFADSISEIKAKSNLFIYELNQSILSSILESNVFIFSIQNCILNKEEDKSIKEHFLMKFKNYVLDQKTETNSNVILVNVKEIYETPEIYLVEPDPFNAVVVIDILKQNNINCVWFRDGKNAFENLKKAHPICIISELAAPGFGGFDLRQKLLEEDLNIPIIILSTQKNDDLLKTASLLGINYFIKKPYFINELLSTIRIFISSNI
ncbi:MAG TPA: response regulator [Exilispira sp.]|nr:response regulator [Exilispira sp.]